MKTIAYLFKISLFWLSLLLISCGQDTQFYYLDGSRHSESEYRGQWLVVNFWAEWCGPCLEEVPELNKLAESASELNLSIIGISYDHLTNWELDSIVKKWDIQYPVMATDPIPLLSFEMPNTLPTNYIISPKGELVKILQGKQTLESLKSSLVKAKNEYLLK